MLRKRAAPLVAALLVAGCTVGTPSATPAPSPTTGTPGGSASATPAAAAVTPAATQSPAAVPLAPELAGTWTGDATDLADNCPVVVTLTLRPPCTVNEKCGDEKRLFKCPGITVDCRADIVYSGAVDGTYVFKAYTTRGDCRYETDLFLTLAGDVLDYKRRLLGATKWRMVGELKQAPTPTATPSSTE